MRKYLDKLKDQPSTVHFGKSRSLLQRLHRLHIEMDQIKSVRIQRNSQKNKKLEELHVKPALMIQTNAA
jgi:hypothetical protein